jgi:hypothetical protein
MRLLVGRYGHNGRHYRSLAINHIKNGWALTQRRNVWNEPPCLDTLVTKYHG